MATFPFSDANPFLDMMRKFGTDLKVPKFALDQMVEAQRKNLEAMASSVSAMTEGAQAMAQKQREIVEASLREATNLAQDLKAQSDQNVARQTEFTKKVFDIAIKGAQDTAQLTRLSTGEAVKILQERMRAGLDEVRREGDQKL